ncbi:RNA polymerase factor sigma-54 [Alkalihalobacillus sp. 1P02AB]|uniref:RNA polymerase factor sigma-54 n=1 Tax=Alkalihalobacillus sp. 1P02AB TaxID=3132260 RepID=UPI0039A70910
MLDFSLVQKQRTDLYMTTELRHAISLLQLSTHELIAHIEEQALENPLLEVELQSEKEATKNDEFQPDYEVRKARQSSGVESETNWLEQISEESTGLHPYLIEQARFLPLTSIQFEQLCYFINHLNDDGYLSYPLDELCSELKISIEEAEEILSTLQQFEPYGVGARTLKECLLIQLQQLESRHLLVEQIVVEHLDNLANKRWKEIAKSCSINLLEVQQAYDFIQQLQPRPGLNFQSSLTRYVTPDVSVYLDKETNEVKVHVHMERIPRITVNQQYVKMMHNPNEDVTKYVRLKHEEVKWLLTSIEKRQSTLKRVTEVIVRHQADFIFKNASLRPLILKDVADELEIHESTVSRVTSNKYLQSPKGLLELKAFFSSAVSSNREDSANTSESIKQLLKQLIAKENKEKPLSDQKLVDYLQKEHQIEISRRAIAKYRNELRIPSSSKRKRYA